MAGFQTAASQFKCLLQGTDVEWDTLELEYEKPKGLNPEKQS